MEYICNDCPRQCGVVRAEVRQEGQVLPGFATVRSSLLWPGRPCMSGKSRASAVPAVREPSFYRLQSALLFCQNTTISMGGTGVPITAARLRDIYGELIEKGAHNINLVTPTPYKKAILESLAEPLPVPVVYNCGGYETTATIDAFKGKVQIYLPDLKYLDPALAKRYSAAEDYPQVATEAILHMYDQVGPYEMDDDGILQKGVVIRHLICRAAWTIQKPSSTGCGTTSMTARSYSV